MKLAWYYHSLDTDTHVQHQIQVTMTHPHSEPSLSHFIRVTLLENTKQSYFAGHSASLRTQISC